jgi:hypothetical protein
MSAPVLAHTGAHGNDECIVLVGKIELRLKGYQFQERNPDRHYCRYFPFLGQMIIKVDSISADLSDRTIELQLLKRKSWSDLVFNPDNAFSVIKQLPAQSFSKQVVSIDSDIQAIDIYAIKLRLQLADNKIAEQRFIFVVGFPFVHVLLGISVLLLLLVIFVFLNQIRKF